MDAAAAQNLRSLVHDCLGKHMYAAAIFFAEKLVTLTDHAAPDVYTFAQALFVDRQHRRCLYLLRNADVIDKDVRFRYLAARCLVEAEEFDECLELLGGIDIEGPEQLSFASVPCVPGNSIDYISAVCLLRGQIFDALENFPRATKWYLAALQCDPLCHEAFVRLAGRHKLTDAEELELINSIQERLPQGMGWLGLLYHAMGKQYDHGGHERTEQALHSLENDPTAEEWKNGTAAAATATATAAAESGDEMKTSTVSESGGNMQKTSAMTSTAGTVVVGPTLSGSSAMRISSISPIQEESEGGGDTATPMGSNGSPSASTGGVTLGCWGLGASPDVAACRAELLFQKGRFQEAYAVTSTALERDPYAETVLQVHLAAAVQLEKRNELFALAHKLVKAQPGRALAWYTAGCYYYVTRQYTSARQYFARVTTMDRSFAPGWIAFAQAFAAQDETDQAMAAFRTAARLFPGLHSPLLGMGLEYARMNNLPLAEQMLRAAHERCPADPAVAHELGTLAYRSGRYQEAVAWLQRALDSSGCAAPAASLEATLVNLGHVLRKLRRWDEAIEAFTKALGTNSLAPGTYAALGYTHHLKGNVSIAIEHYHKCLGLRSEDTFIANMLSIAVDEENQAALVELGVHAN